MRSSCAGSTRASVVRTPEPLYSPNQGVHLGARAAQERDAVCLCSHFSVHRSGEPYYPRTRTPSGGCRWHKLCGHAEPLFQQMAGCACCVPWRHGGMKLHGACRQRPTARLPAALRRFGRAAAAAAGGKAADAACRSSPVCTSRRGRTHALCASAQPCFARQCLL